MKQRTTTILKAAVIVIGLIILVLSVFMLPWLAREIALQNPEYAYLRYPILLGIYATEIPFYYALYQALKLLQVIELGEAFSVISVRALSLIKNCSLMISGSYIAGLFFTITQNANHPSIMLVALGIIFASFVIAVFAGLLQEILHNALVIKTENDLTV